MGGSREVVVVMDIIHGGADGVGKFHHGNVVVVVLREHTGNDSCMCQVVHGDDTDCK